MWLCLHYFTRSKVLCFERRSENRVHYFCQNKISDTFIRYITKAEKLLYRCAKCQGSWRFDIGRHLHILYNLIYFPMSIRCAWNAVFTFGTAPLIIDIQRSSKVKYSQCTNPSIKEEKKKIMQIFFEFAA